MFNKLFISSNRVAWIDNIKLFAIISVMIGHVSATFFSGEPYKDIVHHVLISWSMPLFIFISGYVGFRGFSRVMTWANLNQYLLKMAERIMIPSLAYSSITYIFRMDLLHIIAGLGGLFVVSLVVLDRELLRTRCYKVYLFIIYSLLVVNVVFGLFNDMWYFTLLLRYTILAAFYFFLLNKYGNKVYYSIPIFLFLVFAWKMPWYVNIELLLYFLLGAFLRKFDLLEKWKVGKSLILVIFVSLICAIVSCIFFFFHTFYDYTVIDLFHTHNSVLFFARQLCGGCWCLAITCTIILFSKKYSIFSFWGGKTLPIYGIHATLILVMVHFIKIRCCILGGVSWLYVGCATFVMFLVTIILCSIASKSRYGRLLFLGEKE